MSRRSSPRRPGQPPDDTPSHGWVRTLIVVGLLLVIYFAAPLGQGDDPLPLPVATVLVVGAALTMAWVVIQHIRTLLRDPQRAEVSTLVLLLTVSVVGFAAGYFLLQRSDPGQVTGLRTRLDALYFTLTAATTTGYGDIHPAGQTARAIACMQFLFNAVLLAGLVRTVTFQVSHRFQDRPRDGGA